MSLRAFRWFLILLTFGWLAPLPGRAARTEDFPGLRRKWAYYQSPNFELYSANNERDSRDVLEKMELLRAVFLDVFKLSVRMPQPVTIYSFSDDDDFRGYLPKQLQGGDVPWAGFCQNDADRTVILLAPARDRDHACEVVYHEYIHYLFRAAEQDPAPWFNEGVAELYSTLQGDGKWLQLGDPVAGRVYDLRAGRMMPFEQLFAVTRDSPIFRDSGHTGIFYAQAWALLHYCRFGENKVPPDKMELFLRVAGSARSQEKPDEFRAMTRDLLGMDYPELQQELQRYITNGHFRGRKMLRPAIAARASYAARPASGEEMTVRLAELALRYTQSSRAQWIILDQLGRRPDPRLHELLGAAAMRENDPDRARDHWNSAVDLGTANTAIYRELSRLEANLVFGQFDLYYQLPDARAARLRSLLGKSIAGAPDQSMGYEMLAWVEAMNHQPDIANINLVQKRFGELNDKPRTLLALALVRLRRGETKTALELLDQLDKMNPSDWVKFNAELTRASLERRDVNPANLPPNPGPHGGPVIEIPSLDQRR